jgi:HD-GYP domain-containing protein (c-di-GMP phosphodiesterase class II)
MTVRGHVIGVLEVHGRRPGRYTPAEADLLELLANSAAVAVENARLFGETQRRVQRLSGLWTVDQAITSSFDLRVTLNVLLDQITTQLGVSAADVLVLRRYSGTLDYVAGRGFRTAALQRTSLRLGAGYAGRAALERRIVNVPDLRGRKTDLLRSPLLPQEGFVAYFGVPLLAKGEVKGVLEIFHRGPLDPDREWFEFLETLCGQAAIAIDNVGLFDDLQRTNAELVVAYDATIEGWSRALDLRDRETEGHTERVTEMTLRLARRLGIRDDELVHVRRGALLHDIGKMGIPDAILHKPGPLTEAEWVTMRKHPQYAHDMLSPIAYLRSALDIPYCHHERWDGAGYPRRLKGEQIPLAARLFSVADVWDALRSDRPYRKAWDEARTRAYLEEQAGQHFDAEIARLFLAEV